MEHCIAALAERSLVDNLVERRRVDELDPLPQSCHVIRIRDGDPSEIVEAITDRLLDLPDRQGITPPTA